MAHKGFETTCDDYWTEKVQLVYSHIAIYFSAVSEDEANGKAMRMCKEHFPEKDGWKEHSTDFREIKFKK